MIGTPRSLKSLLGRATGIRWNGTTADDLPDVEIRGITANSRDVQPGDLFVAIAGSRMDGHAFVPDAASRGAAAVIVERDLPDVPPVPSVRVVDTRRALAELAAAWHDDPASSLRLVGITGTLGKTSTLMMLAAILERSGHRIGTIGSLGIQARGLARGTGHTVPGPLALHAGLADIAAAGCEIAAMEVTSHALDQERLHGLRYEMGIFTNLVPMEHADYHGSFREYVAVKCRYFDLLEAGAPLVYAFDDLLVRAVVGDRAVTPIGCGEEPGSAVRIEPIEIAAASTRFVLSIEDSLPLLDGGLVQPQRVEIMLPLLGRPNVTNAALAATAALCLGAPPAAAIDALGSFMPSRRRMEIVHRGSFTVLDDTIGHPDSLSAVFEVAKMLAPRGLHIVLGIRGSRGAQINHLLGQTLAIWLRQLPGTTLVISRSDDVADERNRVEDAEAEAFRAPLEHAGIPFVEHERLDDAVRLVVERAGADDLILLLGAQGMDEGRAILRRLF